MKSPTNSKHERREQEGYLKELSFSRLPYLERVAQLKEQKLPLILYKYHSLHSNNPDKPQEKWEHLCNYLLNSRFYLSPVERFNDPFDMRATIETDHPKDKKRYFLNKLIKTKEPDLTDKERLLKINDLLNYPGKELILITMIYEESVKSCGVFCFTETPCSFLMWSHYANHHRGIALRFNIALDVSFLKWLHRAKYTNEYPIFRFYERQDMDAFIEPLHTKHSEWAYEKEWRLIVPTMGNRYLDFNSKMLTGVILGCRIESEAEDRIRAMIDEREKLRLGRVKLYKVKQHEARYRLVLSK